MAGNASLAAVAVDLIGPLRGTLKPQKGADPEAFVRQLASRLRAFPADVLAATARELLDTRTGGYLPSAPEVEGLAKIVQARLAQARRVAAVQPAGSPSISDPALAARRPALLAALTRRIGVQTVDAWFGGAVPVSFANGLLTLATAEKFHASWITSHYERDLLAAAREVYGPVSRVAVKTEAALRITETAA